jgi:hypothetical protein
VKPFERLWEERFALIDEVLEELEDEEEADGDEA